MSKQGKLTLTPRSKIRAMIQPELANAEITCLDNRVKVIKNEHGTFVEMEVYNDVIERLLQCQTTAWSMSIAHSND